MGQTEQAHHLGLARAMTFLLFAVCAPIGCSSEHVVGKLDDEVPEDPRTVDESVSVGDSGEEAEIGGTGEVSGANDAADEDTGPQETGTSGTSGGADEGATELSTSGTDDGDVELCELDRLPACDQLGLGPIPEWRTLDLGCEQPHMQGWGSAVYLGDPYPSGFMVTDLNRFGGFYPSYGERFLVLSTGDVRYLLDPDQSDCEATQPPRFPSYTCPSWDMETTNWDALPTPIKTEPVDFQRLDNCADLPEMIGQGDCSNSLHSPFNERDCNHPDDVEGIECSFGRGRDLSGYSITLHAPANATGIAFDFVFMTAEYPFHYSRLPTTYADMFIAWLDSSRWTGNISLDGGSRAITSDTRLFGHFDAPHPEACTQDCVAPVLHGTAMAGHAATPWLTTMAPVAPGEELNLTLILFDMGHNFVDSVVLLDNLRWLCSDLDEPYTRLRE